MNDLIPDEIAQGADYFREMLKPFERYQRGLALEQIYPTIPGMCACGCGAPLSGRQKRWSSKECNQKALERFLVIKGDRRTIRGLLWQRDGGFCRCCGAFDQNWQADHAWPIHTGGGACELSNFQTLCPECHYAKTVQQAADQETFHRMEISSQAASIRANARLYALGAAS